MGSFDIMLIAYLWVLAVVQIGYSTQSLNPLCSYYNFSCTTEAIEIKDRQSNKSLVVLLTLGSGLNK